MCFVMIRTFTRESILRLCVFRWYLSIKLIIYRAQVDYDSSFVTNLTMPIVIQIIETVWVFS